MTPEQKRLLAILQYLEDWDKLTQTAVTDVRNYRAGFCAFQAEIQDLPDAKTNLVGSDGEPIWLEIPRLTKEVPPAPIEILRPWILLKDDPTVEPGHRELLLIPLEGEENEEETVVFEDDASLRAEFDIYLQRQWRPWSDKENKRRRCIALYEHLFHIQQTIQNAGVETPVELVWGMGIAVWDTVGNKLCHPLVTQQVELLPLEGGMSLRLRPTTRDPQIEADPFLPIELPDLAAFEKAARKLLVQRDTIPSPFEPESFAGIARTGAELLDTSGQYWPDASGYVSGSIPGAASNLVVTDTWVVFARKRSTNFFVDDLKRLQQTIEEDGVPAGVASYLVEEPEGALQEPPETNFRGLSTAGEVGGAAGCKELYFPKPFNDEQVEIIKKLENLPGVVVQGPPGTGKTHTIANVICHYLAEGKRVLVTSKGETALAVLQGQLPEAIRELTVSLLTNERLGKDQLERAVDNINAKLTTLRTSDLRAEIGALEKTIDGIHRNIALLDTDLRAWARKNTEIAPESIGSFSPEALAREVCALKPMHGWFPDSLDDRSEQEPVVSQADMGVLSAARIALREKLEYADVNISTLASVPDSVRISAVHADLCERGELANIIDRSGFPRLSSLNEEAISLATLLQTEVRDHLVFIGICEAKWLSALRERFRQRVQFGEHEAFLDSLSKLKDEALQLHGAFEFFVATAIELPQAASRDSNLLASIVNASEGKRPFSLLDFGNKAAKLAFEQIRVNGAKPRSAEEWKWVREYCRIVEASSTLVHRWNKLVSGIGGPVVDASPEVCIQELAAHSKAIETATTLACNYDLTLRDRVVRVLPSMPIELVKSERAFLEELNDSLGIQLRQRQLASSSETANSLRKVMSALGGDLFARMREWSMVCLGNRELSCTDVSNQWDAFVAELQELQERASEFVAVREMTDRIKANGAEVWAQRLRTEPVLGGSDPLLPMNWKDAWQWSRQKGYLNAIDGRAQILRITFARHDAETQLRGAYEAIVEKRTWLRLVEKLSLDKAIIRAITAYVQAIRGMTKSGKGKRDVKLRYAAREAMHLASRGVPCWVMPHWRVSEALPAKLGDFDLVVVDEASQSDAWAIPSIIRGAKVLIIGDDKQVGPQPSFTSQSQVDQIQERLKIAGLPSDICNRLDPKESIYDLGELVFAGHTIRLREHFRCAEPIIEFCNKLCYDGEIKCVRVPTASERLLPTLVDVHVREGFRDPRQKINRPEAKAIVDEIASLVASDEFGNRTIGVVSLLGPEQGKLIFDSLLERIGEDAYLKHQIRCGDARTFQGSEADVILISAVDDSRSGAVMTANKLDNIRRVNVAVSRAKDRLYFFHSFARNDLSVLDLRARLMDHFITPIQGLSNARGRELCESGFEREMFDSLVELGYRVIPQVRAGNYRIDLVVEGHYGKRLAVECDGDQYHGPEQWMNDMGRQRLLERAGWKFWRCWGSSFARDRTGCLTDLTKALTNEGIMPIGEGSADFSGIVEFREIGTSDTPPSFGCRHREHARWLTGSKDWRWEHFGFDNSAPYHRVNRCRCTQGRRSFRR